MSCNCPDTNPCEPTCLDANACYDDCGCLNPTTFACITNPGTLPCLGVTNSMNGLQALAAMEATICALTIDVPDPADDKYVKITSADTTANYLASKLVVGSYLTSTILNPGANEQQRINVSPAALISANAGNQLDIGTDGKLRVIIDPPVADILVTGGSGVTVTGTGPTSDPFIVSINPSISVVRSCFDSVWRNVTLVATGTAEVVYGSGNPQYRYRYDGTIEFRGSITHTVNFGAYSGSTRQRAITMGNIPTSCVTAGEQAGTKDLKSVMYIDAPGAGDQITQQYGYIIRKSTQNIQLIFQSSYIAPTSKTIVVDFEGAVSHPVL